MSASVGDLWPWAAVVLLGAYHGINPAMGWLFAVAWGLQEKSLSGVLRAIPPIALGHAASVALVVLLVLGARVVVGEDAIRLAGAGFLLLFGVYRLVRPRVHARGGGMRVGPLELTVWSFLMSTAHGAGLMLLPVLLGLQAEPGMSGHDHPMPPAPELTPSLALGAAVILLHTAAMLAMMTAVALVVYERLGVAILRRAWVNLDLVWALALIAAGIVALVV